MPYLEYHMLLPPSLLSVKEVSDLGLHRSKASVVLTKMGYCSNTYVTQRDQRHRLSEVVKRALFEQGGSWHLNEAITTWALQLSRLLYEIGWIRIFTFLHSCRNFSTIYVFFIGDNVFITA